MAERRRSRYEHALGPELVVTPEWGTLDLVLTVLRGIQQQENREAWLRRHCRCTYGFLVARLMCEMGVNSAT